MACVRALAGLALCLLVAPGARAADAAPASKGAGNGNRLPPEALRADFVSDEPWIGEYLAAFPLEDYEIVSVEGLGRFYLDDNRALVKRELHAGRPWEPGTLEVLRRHATPGSTVLDVGAHIGSHTLPLAHQVGPEGVVYAFEPQKKIYRELVKNLELNGIGNVVPLRFAVGDAHRVIEMNPTGEFDGRTQVGRGGDQAELRTIDSFGFANVSLIKIDVETFELNVLEGAEATIRKWYPTIVVEIAGYYDPGLDARRHVEQVNAFFERNGYELEFVENGGEANFLARYRNP